MKFRVIRRAVAGAAAALLAVSVPVASAAESSEGPSEATLSFSPSTAATPADMTDHILLVSPEGPDEPPAALDSLRIEAPEGTQFDTSVVPQCEASDLELTALGPAACPDSKIGDGRLVALTGADLLDPFNTRVTLLNAAEGPISLVQQPETGLVLTIDRFTIDGNALVANPPAPPGLNPGLRTVTREIEHHWDAGFVTTPGTCDGQWDYNVTIGFSDGTTQTAGGTTPCSN